MLCSSLFKGETRACPVLDTGRGMGLLLERTVRSENAPHNYSVRFRDRISEMNEEKDLKTRIVRMEVSDLDTVVEMDASSRPTPWSKESFLKELQNPLSSCFTLKLKKEATEQVIGFICFRILGEESELLDLVIHSRYRRKGFGKHLMSFYSDFCHERKIKSFYLETGVSNGPAIRLYQSLAYQPIGKRPRFYHGREDALLMMRRACELE
ncbi:MAG TPA: GNAT family N-acetyltransferase [Thermodesulfobacteriota bacterium]|nr:GNAT family N-acetyltransferase [Thermodesulfobacteriota bacterium]